MRCRTRSRCCRVLGHEIRDGYSRVRGRKRRDGLGGPEAEERAEAPAIRRIGGENGLAVHLEHAVYGWTRRRALTQCQDALSRHVPAK